MKYTLLILLSVFFIPAVMPQSVVISKNVDEQYKSTFGPNLRHYGHFYIGLAAMPGFDANSGSAVELFGSGEYAAGYRYKLKLLSFYALGLDLSYEHTRYNFNIDDLSVFNPYNPLTFAQDEKRHLLVNNAFTLEIYQRINFGKRGNTLGNFLDMGIYGSWNHTVKEVIVKTYGDNDYLGKSRLVNRKLDINEPLSYGLSARIGHEKFALYGKYRLSRIF